MLNAMESTLEDLYARAGIPYQYSSGGGRSSPILDRRGFLHYQFLSLRVDPEETLAVHPTLHFESTSTDFHTGMAADDNPVPAG
jgi:hypothetical protein